MNGAQSSRDLNSIFLPGFLPKCFLRSRERSCTAIFSLTPTSAQVWKLVEDRVFIYPPNSIPGVTPRLNRTFAMFVPIADLFGLPHWFHLVQWIWWQAVSQVDTDLETCVCGDLPNTHYYPVLRFRNFSDKDFFCRGTQRGRSVWKWSVFHSQPDFQVPVFPLRFLKWISLNHNSFGLNASRYWFCFVRSVLTRVSYQNSIHRCPISRAHVSQELFLLHAAIVHCFCFKDPFANAV